METSKAGIFSKDGSVTGWPVNGLMFTGKVMGGSGVSVGIGVEGRRIGVGVGGDVVMLGLQADTRIKKSRAILFITNYSPHNQSDCEG